MAGMGAAPPRTRGWTPLQVPVQAALRGSPAHAGMDLRHVCPVCAARRLPRARGDGPIGNGGTAGRLRAPPRTRGWTDLNERGRRAVAGSPAHAGMDPRGRSSGRPCSRLPRARGDGPGATTPTGAA